MTHVRSCPHQCGACKEPKSKFKLAAWHHHGQCMICGGQKSPHETWACSGCWDKLSFAEMEELKAEAKKYVA